MKEFEKWFRKAEGDLYTANLLLKSENCQPDICCYHSQQAAEKYLKSFLVSRHLDFPKTHDLEFLIKLIVLHKPNFNKILTHALAITNYGVIPRYPDDTHEPSNEDAKKPFENAIIIKEFVLKYFFD